MIAWIGAVPGLVTLAMLCDGLHRILRPVLSRRGGDPMGTAIDTGASAAERVGTAIILGVASVPWIILLLDVLHVPIGGVTLFLSAAVVWLAGRRADGLISIRFRDGRLRVTRAIGWWRPNAGWRPGAGRRPWIRSRVPHADGLRSPAAVVLGLATAALILFSVVHVSLVPVRNYDALVGYDLVGKILAREGRLLSSVYDRIVFNAQCVYPPFTSANNGFWYIFLPPVPRLWVPILAAGFLLAFWGIIRRWTDSPVAASRASFLVFLPPALIFQLTVAQTDLPSMILTALAILTTVDLLRGRGSAWLPSLYLLAAATARTENVLFGAALASGAVALRLPRRRRVVAFVLGPAGFFIIWNYYFVRYRMGYDPAAHFRGFDVDFARAAEVLRHAVEIVRDPAAFGELSWLVVAIAILWGGDRIRAGVASRARARTVASDVAGDVDSRKPDGGSGGFFRDIMSGSDLTGALLFLSGICFLFYMPYFYMWDPELNPLWSMEHTYKRGFFRFIPALVTAFVATPPVLALLRRCERELPRAAAPGAARRDEPSSARAQEDS